MATPLAVFLGQLEASIAAYDPIMLRITDKAGDAIKAEAQRRAPRQTGALRKSIKNHGARKLGGQISVEVTAGGPSTPRDVDYAVYVELGTVKMSPRPYMRPAVNKISPLWQKELADVAALLAAGKPGRASGSIRRLT